MRVYLLALLAIITVGIFAFTPSREKVYNQQFKYVGPSTNPDYEDPANWTTSNLESCPGDGLTKCLVTPSSSMILTPEDLVEEIATNGFVNIVINDTRP